jgi:hypothetical protein
MPNSPCTPNLSKKPKALDASFLSQELPHFPLEPLEEYQGDLIYVLKGLNGRKFRPEIQIFNDISLIISYLKI